MRWERTFSFSTSVDSLFDGFMDRGSDLRMIDPDNAYLSNGAIKIEITENVKNEKLSWREIDKNDVWEMSATFSSTETGCTMTLVRSGFGDGDEWLLSATSRLLGWEQKCADIEVYLRTGKRYDRFFSKNAWLQTGLRVTADGGGVRVVSVVRDSLAERAKLVKGDIVLTIAGYPTFGVSDFWICEQIVRDRDGDITFEYIRDGAIETASATREAVPA